MLSDAEREKGARYPPRASFLRPEEGVRRLSTSIAARDWLIIEAWFAITVCSPGLSGNAAFLRSFEFTNLLIYQ